MNRYWYRDIRWGLFASILGSLIFLGGIAFYFFIYEIPPSPDTVERVGVETYIGEGRKDEVLALPSEVLPLGKGGMEISPLVDFTIGVPPVGAVADSEDPMVDFDVTGGDPEFTGGNFEFSGMDTYYIYHERDSMNMSFSNIEDFYIFGTNLAEGRGSSFKFEESLLTQMRSHATESGITLSTYGTLSGPDGQLGAYIITDETPVESSVVESDAPEGDTETSPEPERFYAINMYLWDDETVMRVSGLTTSKTLPEWMTTLHLS